jgi:hypothetical protein
MKIPTSSKWLGLTGEALTVQEAQVVQLARDGLSSPEIGRPNCLLMSGMLCQPVSQVS